MLDDVDTTFQEYAVRRAQASGLGRGVIDIERVDSDQQNPLRGKVIDAVGGQERGGCAVLGGTEVPIPSGVQKHGLPADIAVIEDTGGDAANGGVIEVKDLGRKVDEGDKVESR